MIAGIGIDVVELARIEKIWMRYGPTFAQKILHADEFSIMPENNPIPFLAGRFAAKEAISKALGTGISRGIGFADLCIVKHGSGQPRAILFNAAAQAMQRLGAKTVFISITHSKDVAAAVAILEA